MILSKKNDKKSLNQNLLKSKSGIVIQENDFKIEFMNSVFKNMVGIQKSSLQSENNINKEIV